MKQLLFLAIFLVVGFGPSAFAQCPTTVDAGADQTICALDETVNLNALINGDFFEVAWLPTTGIADPTSASTTAIVNSTTTYEVTVRSFSNENLIQNGDFSQGDQFFTSDYIYGTGGGAGLLSNEGQYAIDNNAGDTHNQFANCPDHTGGGNMMVINASGDASNVWCQQVTVTPDTEYAFSAWVTSVVSQNPAQLQFSINGTLLGDVFNASASTCQWNQFYEVWNSGNTTSAEICIANVNFTPVGNDFAIDDIAFNPVCITTDEITVTLADLNPFWSSPTFLCTNDDPLDLNTLLDPISTPGGVWTVNGLPLDVVNPAVLSPGNYAIQYTVMEGMCEESSEQNIQIVQSPDAEISLNQDGFCVGEDIEITFTGSASASASFNWNFGPFGIETGPGPFSFEAMDAQVFPITLTVSDNACSSEDAALIQIDEPPLTDLEINCNATPSSVEFSWPEVAGVTYEVEVIIGPNGNLTSPSVYLIDGLDPSQSVAIQVTALFEGIACESAVFQSFCNSEACPTYTLDVDVPQAACQGDAINLDLSILGSDGPFDIEYLINGVAMSLSNTPANASLSLPTLQDITFELVSIIDQSAPDCPVNLSGNFTIPVIVPQTAGTDGDAASLCDDASQSVNLADLINGEDLNGVWTESSNSTGNAFDPASGTFNTASQAPGTYTFIYTQDGQGVCPSSSATATVIINETPTADAGQDLSLSCGASNITIGGTGSSIGPDISYNWTSPDGGQISDPATATTDISSGGTFILTVANTQTGCSSSDQIIVIEGNDELAIETSTTPVDCVIPNSGTIQVDAVTGGMPPYMYSINGSNFSSNSVFTNLSSGTYMIEVQDATGCLGALELTLAEPEQIVAEIVTVLGNNNVLLPLGESLKLDLQIAGNVDTIIWSPAIESCDGCQTPVVSPLESTVYIATVIDENGCTASDAIEIFIERLERVFIPNVFSPNDDGFNDIFYVNAGDEVTQIKDWQIMDRWGNQVFSMQNVAPNDPSVGWDGKFRGQLLNPGVFVYYVELELQTGESLQLKGELSLLR